MAREGVPRSPWPHSLSLHPQAHLFHISPQTRTKRPFPPRQQVRAGRDPPQNPDLCLPRALQSHKCGHMCSESRPPPWPPGFQMAPCGCFFDPRIYRIEWAPSDYGQSPLCKLTATSSVGAPVGPAQAPSTYVMEPSHFLKAPLPPPPYPHFPPPPGGSQYLMPYFPPEGAGPEALSFVGEGAPPNVDLPPPPPLLKKGLAPPATPKDKRLLVTVPAEPPLHPTTYNHLKGRLSQLQGPESIPLPPEPPVSPTEELQEGRAGLGTPGEPRAVEAEVRNPPLGAGEERPPEPPKPLALPDKVLLEDAMKLFDCFPAATEPRGCSPRPALHLPDSGGGGDDSGGDIRALRLPEDLLSTDYSVPELLDAMCHVDYFFDFKALDDEPGTPTTPRPAPPPGRRKSSVGASKKGRQVGKGRQATAPH